nr:hypothetical protein [uncultured Cohaesibacter sp.]
MDETISWDELLWVYENTDWSPDGDVIRIVDERLLETLKKIEKSDKASRETDISVLSAVTELHTGEMVAARIGCPLMSIGILAEDIDGVISAPKARIKERNHYYIKSNRTHSDQTPESDEICRYRSMLNLVNILEKAALFLDPEKQILVFYKNKRVNIPINYTSLDLKALNTEKVKTIYNSINEKLHQEQRVTILAEAIFSLVENIPENNRFQYISKNISELCDRLNEGYRLFTSSFSYSKIKDEIESAHVVYIEKIHKTFTDIQGQILGLPIATIVVATQYKPATQCGSAVWSNIAILAGAWLFAALLIASCVNQWLTLSSISREICGQQNRLNTKFSEIKPVFSKEFLALRNRLCWHRILLMIIAVTAIVGAIFASYAFKSVNQIKVNSCITQQNAPLTDLGTIYL